MSNLEKKNLLDYKREKFTSLEGLVNELSEELEQKEHDINNLNKMKKEKNNEIIKLVKENNEKDIKINEQYIKIKELEKSELDKRNNYGEDIQNKLILPKEILNMHIVYPLIVTLLKENCLTEFNEVMSCELKIEEYSNLEDKYLNNILKCCYKYLEKLDDINDYNLSCINRVLESLDNNQIDKNFKELYNNIFSLNRYNSHINKKILLSYVIRYFIRSKDEESKTIIDLILKNRYYLSGYDKEEYINLILMAKYFNLFLGGILKDLESQKIFDNDFKFNLEKLIKNNKLEEVIEEIIKKQSITGEYSIYDKKLVKNIKKRIKNTKNLNHGLSKIPEIKEIVITNNQSRCDKHKILLDSKDVYVKIYDKNNIYLRSLKTKALWCQRCNSYVFNRNLLGNIYKNIINNEKINFKSMGNLNEISPLKALGYNTTLSRSERFDLINQVLVPALGVRKIISHLTFLIKLNEKKTNKDFSKSITEWTYDINMVINKYGIK